MTEKILVIDDDTALLRAISIRLRTAGFQTVTAVDGASGAQLAARERPDLIILDIDMPHYSGLELHECLRFAGRVRGIPVMYLSGNDSLLNRATAHQLGARAFLTKPYDPMVLLNAVKEVLARFGPRDRSGNETEEERTKDASTLHTCSG